MDLLTQLNFAHPGLERAGEAHRAGRTEEAQRMVLDYYRSRTAPAWYAPIEAEADLPECERIMRRVYNFQNREARVPEPFDWKFDPVNDPEWPYLLNRHKAFATLLSTYRATGDEKYAAYLDWLIAHWCENNPRPSERLPGEKTWRSIEAGIRMLSTWVPTWLGLQHSPSFRLKTRWLMLTAFWDHAWLLTHINAATGNWILMEMNGLAHVATYFPEFTDAPRWMEYARTKLEQEIDRQVIPGGAQAELCNHYHWVALRNFVQPLALPGFKVSEHYGRVVESMFDWVEALRRPDGWTPMLADSDEHPYPPVRDGGLVKTAWIDALPEPFRKRMSVVPPVPTESMSLWESGYFIMRADGLYLIADAGPYGMGHQHEDKLSVEVFGCGAPLLVDPGRFQYNYLRRYFLHTSAHSTVLVDGQGQNRLIQEKTERWWSMSQNPPVVWESGERFDLVDGVYDEGYGPDADRAVTHRRRILFVKPRYWIVVDDMSSSSQKTHVFESLWHIRPDTATAVEPNSGAAFTVDADRGNILIIGGNCTDVRVISGGPGTERPEVLQGWYSPEYGLKRPCAVVAHRYESKAPCRMVTLLYPFPAGVKPAVSLSQEAQNWRVTYPGGSDLIVVTDATLEVQ